MAWLLMEEMVKLKGRCVKDVVTRCGPNGGNITDDGITGSRSWNG